MVDSTLLLKGTLLRPPMGWSSWMVRLQQETRVSIWNVRNMCETSGWFWICVGTVIVILMVLSGGPSGISISDDRSQLKETDKNAA